MPRAHAQTYIIYCIPTRMYNTFGAYRCTYHYVHTK